MSKFIEIPINLIDPSPYQHRRIFTNKPLKELASSIKRDGLIEPVVARALNNNGRYELIAGERRLRAAKIAKLSNILTRVVNASDIQARRMCATENLQREDLSPVEEIEAIVEMIDAEMIEDEYYQLFGDEPVLRVTRFLKKRQTAEKNNYVNSICNVTDRVDIIFKSLPKPKKWESFLRNDLPLLNRIDNDVLELGARIKASKARLKALQKMKSKTPKTFKDVKSAIKKAEENEEENAVITKPGLIEDVEIDILEASAAELDRITDATINPHIAHNAGENEWYTPKEYINAAYQVMGNIDLDPASTQIANATIKAAKFYSKKDNGLSKDWHGNIWLNPPYSLDLIKQFANKLAFHYANKDVKQFITLINNATETEWFCNLAQVSEGICFPSQRVRFWEPGGKVSAPLQGQAVLYGGDNFSLFSETFKPLGIIARIIK